MLSKKTKKNNFGFTIIELMVSASIIAIISALAVVNLRGSEQKSTLDNETERLSSVMRQAHINSLIGLTVGGVRPLGGFGLHIGQCASNCSYLLFADDGNFIYDAGIDTIVDQINMLDENVSITLTQPTDPFDIVFSPPRGNIYINGNTLVNSATTTLGFVNTSYSKQIIINRFSGRIDIQ